jgi:nicotinamidase-related amidase
MATQIATPSNSETANASTTALLLIDFQRDFLEETGRMPVALNQVEPVLMAARRAIDEARAKGELMFAIGNEFRPGDVILNFFRRGASLEGSRGAEWDPRLPLADIPYLAKWATSSFVNPELHARLQKAGIKHLVLAGLQAKACITGTARDALKLGYDVSVLAEATACVSDASRKRSLTQLEKRGVKVT